MDFENVVGIIGLVMGAIIWNIGIPFYWTVRTLASLPFSEKKRRTSIMFVGGIIFFISAAELLIVNTIVK